MQNTIMQRMPISALLGFLSSIAQAQSPAQSVVPCADITDNAQRLACYDNLFQKSSRQHSAPTVTTATHSATPARAAPESSSAAVSEGEFGGEFRKPKSGDKRLKEVMTGVAPIGQGLYRLTLSNGQVWETTQADWSLEFRTSEAITISRMVLGNYLISLPGQGHTVAVKRVQ